MSVILKDLDSLPLISCYLVNPKDRCRLALSCQTAYEKIKFTFLFKQTVHRCDHERKKIDKEMKRKIGMSFHALNRSDKVDAHDWLSQFVPFDEQIKIANFWNTFNNDTFNRTKNPGLLIKNFDEAQVKFLKLKPKC